MNTPEPHDDHSRIDQDFDEIERLTQSVKQWGITAAIVSPIWLLMLAILGAAWGPSPIGFVLATLVAVAAAFGWRRLFGPARQPRQPRPKSPFAVPPIAFVVAGAILVVYLLVILRATS